LYKGKTIQKNTFDTASAKSLSRFIIKKAGNLLILLSVLASLTNYLN